MVIPKHLGLILDGNRRWAKAKGLPTLEGHKQGSENFKTISLAAFDHGVEYVSAYVFSAENWQRTEEEVRYLMTLLMKAVEKHLKTFHKANIRIVLLGRRDGLSDGVLKSLEKSEALTKDNTRGTLALCFNYGGKDELVDAVRHIIAGGFSPNDVNTELLSGSLYHPEIPEIDLLIRTSGEQRTSGFMLYRADYAELYFTDVLWPDFDETELKHAFNDYASRKRRFGS